MNNKYSDSDITIAVSKSKNVSEVLRSLGIKVTGGSHGHIKKRISKLWIDTSHFLGSGSNIGRTFIIRLRTNESILTYRDKSLGREKTHLLKRAMINSNIQYSCEQCSINSWNNKPLVLEIDHIDWDYQNNILSNLRFICPNCHSQQSTNYKTSP